ncbi:MAG: hypothetical protein IJ192_15340, partial [Clostridia bacterium]|nr:hypothetical protein [Clostridia bacterium]
EVYTMMSELFDEEYQRNQYDIAVKRIEREEGKAKLLKKLSKLGNSIKQLSEMFEMPENKIETLITMDC